MCASHLLANLAHPNPRGQTRGGEWNGGLRPRQFPLMGGPHLKILLLVKSPNPQHVSAVRVFSGAKYTWLFVVKVEGYDGATFSISLCDMIHFATKHSFKFTH